MKMPPKSHQKCKSCEALSYDRDMLFVELQKEREKCYVLTRDIECLIGTFCESWFDSVCVLGTFILFANKLIEYFHDFTELNIIDTENYDGLMNMINPDIKLTSGSSYDPKSKFES